MNTPQYPAFLICGIGGSGKDTLAAMIAKHAPGTQLIALADPMKRLAQHVFEFTDDQLWGPSASRNAADDRYRDPAAWDLARARTWSGKPEKMLEEVALAPGDQTSNLKHWFDDLAGAHGMFPLGKHQAYYQFSSNPANQVYPVLTPRYVVQTIGTELGQRRLGPGIWIREVQRKAAGMLYDNLTYDARRGWAQDRHTRTALVGVTDGRLRAEVLDFKAHGYATILIYEPAAPQLVAGVAGHETEAQLGEVPRSWYDFVVRNDKSEGLAALDQKAFMIAERLAPNLVEGQRLR